MARHLQHGSPSSAAQPALASDGAAQLSSLPGGAEQPVDCSYKRVWDGELYTQAEFREQFGWYLGEALWDSALDWWEAKASQAPRRRSAQQPIGTMTFVARDDADHIRISTSRPRSAEQPASSLNGTAQISSPRHRSVEQPASSRNGVAKISSPRRRSVEQPAASLNVAASIALDVHETVHAKLTEYMAFLSRTLNDIYGIWRSEGEPKRARSSWSSQWNNLTRMLEAIARDAAANNCLHESDLSLSSVVQPASIEKLSATAALLGRKVMTTCKKEAEFLILLDRLAHVTVHKACLAEVERFFELDSGHDAAFNTRCALEAGRELNECNLDMKNVAAEARRLLDVPSLTTDSPV